MREHIFRALLLASMVGTGPAAAQQIPLPVTSQNLSSSITSTNTFQVVFANQPSLTRRNGCAIQNNGSNTMYVYVHQGASGTATKNSSYQLAPPGTGTQGGVFICATGAGGIIQDQIDITGTSGDTFAATIQ